MDTTLRLMFWKANQIVFALNKSVCRFMAWTFSSKKCCLKNVQKTPKSWYIGCQKYNQKYCGSNVTAFWGIFTQQSSFTTYLGWIDAHYKKVLVKQEAYLYFCGVGRWCRWCAVLVSWQGIRRVWLPMTLRFDWRDGVLDRLFHWQSVSFFVWIVFFVSLR